MRTYKSHLCWHISVPTHIGIIRVRWVKNTSKWNANIRDHNTACQFHQIWREELMSWWRHILVLFSSVWAAQFPIIVLPVSVQRGSTVRRCKCMGTWIYGILGSNQQHILHILICGNYQKVYCKKKITPVPLKIKESKKQNNLTVLLISVLFYNHHHLRVVLQNWPLVALIGSLTWACLPMVYELWGRSPSGHYCSYYQPTFSWVQVSATHLTHLPLDKMAAISQTIFSDIFFVNESFVFW